MYVSRIRIMCMVHKNIFKMVSFLQTKKMSPVGHLNTACEGAPVLLLRDVKSQCIVAITSSFILCTLEWEYLLGIQEWLKEIFLKITGII